jgi:hypothetical protein
MMKSKKATAMLFTLVLVAFAFGKQPTANKESILRQNREMLKSLIDSGTVISEMPELAFLERSAKKALKSNEDFQRLIQDNPSECNWILQLNKGCFEYEIVHVISFVAQPNQPVISEADEDRLSFLCRLATGRAYVTFDRSQTTDQNRIIVIESGVGRNGSIRRKLTREYVQTFEGEDAKWVISERVANILQPQISRSR